MRVTVKKGLTRAAALKAAKAKIRRRRVDFRGFTYDPKTGNVVLT